MPDPWLDLCAAVGGREALAKLCSVDETTIWRWAHGEHRPHRLVRESVNRIAAEHGCKVMPFL